MVKKHDFSESFLSKKMTFRQQLKGVLTVVPKNKLPINYNRKQLHRAPVSELCSFPGVDAGLTTSSPT